jgi:hypothetical protein
MGRKHRIVPRSSIDQAEKKPAGQLERKTMFRRIFLSAALGTALVAGITMTPASADAHPRECVPVRRPVFYPAHEFHHHHALFGVQFYGA